MDRKSLENLRMDRRVIGRRSWLAKAELSRELEALPDTAEKATSLGEANDEKESSPAQRGEQAPQG